MGVTAARGTVDPHRIGVPIPPGPDQDQVLARATADLQDKGFLATRLGALVDWARTGSL